MYKLNCNIDTERETIFTGDLVKYRGTLGIVTEVVDEVTDTEVYCIVGFEGRTLKNYGENYIDIDTDADVQLVCKRDELIITLTNKRGK